jgi:2-iminoacetate synthase ThiH
MLSVERICQLIEEAGRTPVERDTLYRPILRDAEDPTSYTVDQSL